MKQLLASRTFEFFYLEKSHLLSTDRSPCGRLAHPDFFEMPDHCFDRVTLTTELSPPTINIPLCQNCKILTPFMARNWWQKLFPTFRLCIDVWIFIHFKRGNCVLHCCRMVFEVINTGYHICVRFFPVSCSRIVSYCFVLVHKKYKTRVGNRWVGVCGLLAKNRFSRCARQF
jgi:hypothetical protein